MMKTSITLLIKVVGESLYPPKFVYNATSDLFHSDFRIRKRGQMITVNGLCYYERDAELQALRKHGSHIAFVHLYVLSFPLHTSGI